MKQTGNRNMADFWIKSAKKNRICSPIAEISPSYKKSGSRNPMALSKLQPQAQKWLFLRTSSKIWLKLSKTLSNRKNFHPFIMKSMSLRMTVTTEFGPEVQVMAFVRMSKKKW